MWELEKVYTNSCSVFSVKAVAQECILQNNNDLVICHNFKYFSVFFFFISDIENRPASFDNHLILRCLFNSLKWPTNMTLTLGITPFGILLRMLSTLARNLICILGQFHSGWHASYQHHLDGPIFSTVTRFMLLPIVDSFTNNFGHFYLSLAYLLRKPPDLSVSTLFGPVTNWPPSSSFIFHPKGRSVRDPRAWGQGTSFLE